MYGNQKKCEEQIESDNIFLMRCDSLFKSRKEACAYYVSRAWDHFYANNQDSSMKRFNQAWLLDSSNYEVYWGFGNLLGRKQKFKESLAFFERALKLNPNNAKLWESASTSFGQIFFQTKDVSQLNICIDYLKHSLQLDTDARVLSQLTAAYSYFIQSDSAKKYLKLTDKIDPSAINPEVRQLLDKK